jgi:DNA-binding NarL/FixJ family response regulator
MNDLIRIVLADDHPLVRAGIRATLQAEPHLDVVGEAANGDETRQICVERKPDVLLLDLHMPGPPPTETVAYLRAHATGVKIIVLTAYDDQAYVRGMLAAGVMGYIVKEEATETVVRAIHAVMRGDRWLSQSVIAGLTGQAPTEADDPIHRLTERERDILRLIAVGWDNVRIAHELNLAEQTVRNYISRVYAAIGVRTRAEAIIWARDRDSARE